MKVEKLIKMITLSILLFITPLMGSQAYTGLLTFEQADGSTFDGQLKGDSALNWIESAGNIIKYNPEDKYYYIVTISEENEFIFTKNKANKNSIKHAPSANGAQESIKEKLKIMREKRKDRSLYPR